MKKKLSLILAIMGLMALFVYSSASCTKESDPQLNINETLLVLDALDLGTDSINIVSNTSWTTSCSESWLTVTPDEGINNGTIKVIAGQNTGEARSASITVTGKGVVPKTILVKQKSKTTLSVTQLDMGCDENSTIKFNIISDTTWTIMNSESWLSVSATEGSKNSEITLTATQNNDTAARIALLTIDAKGSPLQTLTVKQVGAVYTIVVSTVGFSIGPDANSTGTFDITSNAEWTISCPQNWLTIEPQTGTGNTTVLVTAQQLTVSKARTVNLTITAPQTDPKKVKVTQTGIPCNEEDENYCSATGCIAPTMPDFTALTANRFLPDPFMFIDGSRMTTKADWVCRRNEIAAQAQEFEYGYKPCTPYEATSGAISGNTLVVTVTGNGKAISFNCTITYPTTGSAPYPAMIGIGGSFLDNTLLLSMGVAIISFPNDDVALQNNSGSRGIGKFYDFFCNNHSAGALMAWSWGVSRLIDAIEKTPEANIDAERLGVTGCSRNGKGALCAGAFDERIVLTVPQESGSGGAASWRVSDFQMTGGTNVQTLSQITTENCWFRSNFSRFGSNATKLPYDHHMIEALCAPRALLVIENTSMVWLGNVSTWTTGNAAHMVWQALGVPENMGFSQFGHGDHCGFPSAQQPELKAYVKKFLLGDGSENTIIMKNDGSLVFDTVRWVNWTIPELQ